MSHLLSLSKGRERIKLLLPSEYQKDILSFSLIRPLIHNHKAEMVNIPLSFVKKPKESKMATILSRDKKYGKE